VFAAERHSAAQGHCYCAGFHVRFFHGKRPQDRSVLLLYVLRTRVLWRREASDLAIAF